MPLIIKNDAGGGTNLMTTSSTNLDVDLYNLLGNEDFPVGTIMIYNADITKLPASWFVCDGKNGTPNLNDRIPMCVNHPSDSIKKAQDVTGGYSESQLLFHTHTVSITAAPSHSHVIPSRTFKMDNEGKHSHTQYESPQNGARGVYDSCYTTPHGIPIYTKVVEAASGAGGKHTHSVDFANAWTSYENNHNHSNITTHGTGKTAGKGTNIPKHIKMYYIMKVK